MRCDAFPAYRCFTLVAVYIGPSLHFSHSRFSRFLSRPFSYALFLRFCAYTINRYSRAFCHAMYCDVLSSIAWIISSMKPFYDTCYYYPIFNLLLNTDINITIFFVTRCAIMYSIVKKNLVLFYINFILIKRWKKMIENLLY